MLNVVTGHNNIVAISATIVTAEESLRLMEPNERQCMYENENRNLSIHKYYSQSNCYFECFYYRAKEFVKIKYNTTRGCVPWYFPTPYDLPLFCNPWEAADFHEKLLNVSTENCQQCLPDCNVTTYKTHVTAVPLRNCYLENSANSQLCNNELQNPTRISSILKELYESRFGGYPYYMKTYDSSLRETLRLNERKMC